MNLDELAARAAKAKAEKAAATQSFDSFRLKAPQTTTPSKPAAAPAAPEAFDLDSVDLDDYESKAAPTTGEDIVFDDHISVDKPIRELAPELTEQQLGFVNLLDSVHELHHDAEAIKSAVARIMIDMKETPYLSDLVLDADVTCIIAKMKMIQGYRKVKETKAKAKRATSKKAVADAEMAALLGDEFAGLKF